MIKWQPTSHHHLWLYSQNHTGYKQNAVGLLITSSLQSPAFMMSSRSRLPGPMRSPPFMSWVREDAGTLCIFSEKSHWIIFTTSSLTSTSVHLIAFFPIFNFPVKAALTCNSGVYGYFILSNVRFPVPAALIIVKATRNWGSDSKKNTIVE